MSTDGSNAQDQAVDRMRSEVMRYVRSGELLPDAAEMIPKLLRQYGSTPPATRAEKVAEFVAGEAGARYRNPEHAAAAGPVAPLRRVLNRFAADLKPGVIDELVIAYGSRLNHLPEPKIAGRVAELLGDRDFATRYGTAAPYIPAAERRLADLIREHFPEVTDVDGLARQLNKGNPATLSATQTVRNIAVALGTRPLAEKYADGQQLAPDDARRRVSIPEERPAGPPRAGRPMTGI